MQACCKPLGDLYVNSVPTPVRDVLAALLAALYEAVPPSIIWSVVFAGLDALDPKNDWSETGRNTAYLGLIQLPVYTVKTYLAESAKPTADKNCYWGVRWLEALINAIPDAVADAVFVASNYAGMRFIPQEWGKLKILVMAFIDCLATGGASLAVRFISNWLRSEENRRPIKPSAMLTALCSLAFTLVQGFTTEDGYDPIAVTACIYLAMLPVQVVVIRAFAPSREQIAEATLAARGEGLASGLFADAFPVDEASVTEGMRDFRMGRREAAGRIADNRLLVSQQGRRNLLAGASLDDEETPVAAASESYGATATESSGATKGRRNCLSWLAAWCGCGTSEDKAHVVMNPLALL